MLIKIGELWINQDHIVFIEDDFDEVHVLLDISKDDKPMWESFVGEQRRAFLDWLEYKAEVSVVI